MAAAVRALTYATLFIGLVLIYLPAQVLSVLWVYAGAFLSVMHLVVVWYEEPALRRTFGEDYEQYLRQVRRWLPAR